MQHFEKNVTFMLIWWQEQIIERLAVQHPKPCCWNSLWFSVVLLKYAWPSLKKASSWWGSMCFSITCRYLSVFIVHFQMCKLPDPKPLMHPSVRDAGFRTEHWWLNKPDSPVLYSVEDTASMFLKIMSHFDESDHRRVFILASVHFKRALSQRRQQMMFSFAPSLLILWMF